MAPMQHTVKLEGLPEGWQGSLVMEAPLHTERLKVISKAGFHKMGDPRKLEEGDKLGVLFEQQLPALIHVYEIARALIREVNIVGPEGQVIKTLDEFDRHEATAQCFAEVATAYLLGFGPGKKKSQG